MRYLLAAINAKYIHSNLGIYSLRRYAMERLGLGQKDEQGAAVGMEMVSEAAEGANRTKTVSEIQIDLGEGHVAGDGDLLRGHHVTGVHDRDERGVNAAPPQHVDDGQAFDGLKSIGGEYGNSGHGKSSRLDAAMPELYPHRPLAYQTPAGPSGAVGRAGEGPRRG